MSKNNCSILYCNLLCKKGQDFLNIQCSLINYVEYVFFIDIESPNLYNPLREVFVRNRVIDSFHWAINMSLYLIFFKISLFCFFLSTISLSLSFSISVSLFSFLLTWYLFSASRYIFVSLSMIHSSCYLVLFHNLFV